MGPFTLTPASHEFFCAAAIAAAAELGIFEALPATVEELARARGLGAHRLRILVDALVWEGVLERDGERIVLVELPPIEPPVREGFGRLAEVLRADKPLESEWLYHHHLQAAAAGVAAEVAERLRALAPLPTLVDLGGGLGAYATAFGAATLVDKPEVIARVAPREGLALIGGDLFALELEPHGAALLSNVLHLYDGKSCARLCAIAAGAVVPGGVVAVKDFSPDGAVARYFALTMALYTESGDVWAPETIVRWLAEAGLQDPAVEICSDGQLLIWARK